MKEKIMDEAKKTFRPEFLNRLDDVIVFRSLTKADLLEILDLEISKVMERLKAKQLHLLLDQTAKDFLVEKVTTPLTAPVPCAAPSSAFWKTRWPRRFSKATCTPTSRFGRGRGRQTGL